MEQNKVLMVIVSVVIFFAAIVGVGMALLYPRGDETAQAASGSVVREFDPIEYVRSPDSGEMAEAEEDETDDVVIVYGDLPEEPSPAEDETDQPVVEERTDDAPAEVTITERPARTPRAAIEPNEPETDTAPAAPERRQDPEPSRTEPTQPQPEAPAESTPEPRQIRVTEYWIQLISSPNRDRVDQARATLTDYSLGGRVTTRDIEGELFYRLRVGPYDSHAEAEKFLEWIRDIDGFGEAYISEEYPLRTVRS
ncbi:MAG TPA: SPOR domain-containing protein [Alkalispirochaeta sp.]|nr:SPOR domain-containing protein [Alkalispirochaeta sp.]